MRRKFIRGPEKFRQSGLLVVSAFPMVVVSASAPAESCVWTHWRELIDAAGPYAKLTGWRFVLHDFMALDRPQDPAELRAARARAMPTVVEFGERVRACAAALESAAPSAPPPELVSEFRACQRLVASEAVYNSMLATLRAVGLGDENVGGEVPDEEAMMYHDMSQPMPVVARRLCAHAALMRASPDAADERSRRVRHASFVVEFGLEHGLSELRDETSESTLTDFLQRLGEWQATSPCGVDGPMVASRLLSNLPDGPASRTLREAALAWAEANQGSAIVTGAIVGGVVGVLAASAFVALASARGGRSR